MEEVIVTFKSQKIMARKLCPNEISFLYFWIPMNEMKRKNIEDHPTQTVSFFLPDLQKNSIMEI